MTPTILAKFEKSANANNWQGYGEKGAFWILLMDIYIGATALGNNIELTCRVEPNPAIILPGKRKSLTCVGRDMFNHVQNRISYYSGKIRIVNHSCVCWEVNG